MLRLLDAILEIEKYVYYNKSTMVVSKLIELMY